MPFMTNQLQTHHRVIGALLGAWLALFISSLLLVGFTAVTLPLAAAFGATRWAQRFARPAIALVGGVATASFISGSIAAGSLVVVFAPVATTLIYLMLGDLATRKSGFRHGCDQPHLVVGRK